MAEYFKEPQSPLKQKDMSTGDIYYIYPLTTDKQVILDDGSRLNTKITELSNIVLEKATAGMLRATLYTDKWVSSEDNFTQTIVVNGVSADSDKQAIITVADSGSLDMYLDCNIRLMGNGEHTLTFSCDVTPSSEIIVNILIITKGE